MSSSLGLVSWPDNLPTPLPERTHMIEPRDDLVVMESNRKRKRRKHLTSLELLQVVWVFTADQYDTFRDFFINSLDSGVNEFILVTKDLTDDPSKVDQVTRTVAFLDGTYSDTQEDGVFTVSATLIIESEEVVTLPAGGSPDDVKPFPIPVITPTIEYSDCLDEITVSWTGIAEHVGDISDTGPGVRNVSIWHAASAEGPWLWWGETRKPVSQVVVGNYFKTRWVKVVAETLTAAIPVALFKPLPPAVDPPRVIVNRRLRTADISTGAPLGVSNWPLDTYDGDAAASPFFAAQLPYSGGYSGIDKYIGGVLRGDTARDRISALGEPNFTDSTTESQPFKVNLFSEAFVEIGWRYYLDYFSGWDGSQTGYAADVILESDQAGVTMKWTKDGTNPTPTHGLNSAAQMYPWASQYWPEATTVPYIIARAFKDGCQSPPVYVPIDVLFPQFTAFRSELNFGTNSQRAICPVNYRDLDCKVHPEFYTGSPYLSGPNDGLTPCTADLTSMRDGVLANCELPVTVGGVRSVIEARIGEYWEDSGKLLLRTYQGDTMPYWTGAASMGETYYGEDPGGCSTSSYGGGSWRMAGTMYWIQPSNIGPSFYYQYDPWFGLFSNNAFHLLDAKVEHTQDGATTQIVLPDVTIGCVRPAVPGLNDPAHPDGSGNGMVASLVSAFQCSFSAVFGPGGDHFPHDSLTAVNVSWTCAAF